MYIMLTEKEMLVAKIGLLSGAVVFGKQNRIKATEILMIHAEKHGFTTKEALDLEEEIDQMLGDDTLT